MPRMSVEDLLLGIDNPYRGKRRSDVDDLRELLEEYEEELRNFSTRRVARLMAVTSDRRKKDQTFSYWLFDELLLHLSRYAGGSGISKPANQLRVMSWRGDASDLLSLLKLLCRQHPNLMYRRLLVIPFPNKPSGHRIDRHLYRR